MRPTSRTEVEAGFTLIEMLTVLTVIAILSVVMAGRLPDGGPGVDHVAAELARDLRGLRFEAVTTGRDIAVAVSGEGAANLVALPEGVTARVLSGAGEEVEQLVFFGEGGSTGGTVEVMRGEARTRIGVDWLTGVVTRE